MSAPLHRPRPGEEADLTQALQFSQHVPFETEDWRAAAKLERELRGQALTIPRNDLFVATVAIRAKLTIACRDAHFDAVKRAVGDRLTVEQL